MGERAGTAEGGRSRIRLGAKARLGALGWPDIASVCGRVGRAGEADQSPVVVFGADPFSDLCGLLRPVWVVPGGAVVA